MSQRDYEDPSQPGALGGVRAFAKAHDLKDAEAKRRLEEVLSYTLHRPTRRRFPTVPTLVFSPHEQWQMDLVDMQKLGRWNGGFKYMLTVIDVFSKLAWAEPLKTKGAKHMVEALERVKKTLAPLKPLRVQTDQGTEFYNALVQAWFKKEGWHHFSTFGDSKASVVERWHRTLKQRMYRYFTAHSTLRWVDALPKLVTNYNGSYHRSLGMSPLEVKPENESKVWMQLYGTRLRPKTNAPKPTLKVGDKVRLNKKHRPFKKSYLPGWTEEVFLVTSVRPRPIPTYQLSEWDGTPIKGTFYQQDVQKVRVSDESLFRVEKVVKSKRGQVLVRWKGWPSKYDSWIRTKDLQSTTKKKSKKKAS